MKTQAFKYKTLSSLLFSLAVIAFSSALMAPACNEREYKDENYPDGTQGYVDEGDYTNEAQQASSPPPEWAPSYSNVNVRYYYFPDYYMYYDVWSSQYVYWDGFGWVYVNTYPAFIGPFNPYHAHIVILRHNVYRPWMNHGYYVEQYPQYYYQNNYYGHRDNSVIRGYDENQREAVYAPRKDNNQQSGPRQKQQNTESGKRNIQNNIPEKNRQEVPLNKNQDRPQQNRKPQQPDFQKQAPDNRQKNFERPQQKREIPLNNFQRQQKPHSAPMQKQPRSNSGSKKR